MGEKTSRSLDWPFLCDVCKQEEEQDIANGTSEWPADYHITWDRLSDLRNHTYVEKEHE